MALDNPTAENLQTELFPMLVEARKLNGIDHPGVPIRMDYLSLQASEMLVGKTVQVSSVYPESVDPYTFGPITARYFGVEEENIRKSIIVHTDIERRGTWFYLPHPRTATGTVRNIDLETATMTIQPRIFSPYRIKRGYFWVSLLSPSGKPNVKIEMK